MSRPDAVHSSMMWRARLGVGILVLTALMFRQFPGEIVPDTKLDLTADPGVFLQRALSMWDPHGALGQLQNQAYGYLFPVGPFHLLGVGAGLPEWVVQRLWWSTVLGVAFVGFWRLSGALRVGTPWLRYLGAFLFALSPRFLSEVGVTSVEVWPMAMAPWVLTPLVAPTSRGWVHRILRSAVAFALVGGVNAVATGVTLVLPTLWFLTRERSRRTMLTFLAWLAACLLAGLWWLVPLVQLGRFSPPFLDWIEDSGVTTSTASPFDALQGTTPWLNFLTGAAGPSWPGGWDYVTTPLLVLLSTLVAVTGLVGLSRRDLPEALWLRLATATGFTLLTLGFAGTSPGFWSGDIQGVLDGALAPLRNIHKFEVVIRIPLLLGAVHALAVMRARPSMRRVPSAAMATAVVLLVVAVAAPVVATSSLARPEGYPSIPRHWDAAARWLDAQPAPGTVLVLPAASFADFTWGSTKDEPFQALLDRPFVVRDAVPLGSAGTTRFLDEVERRVGAGRGGDDLRSALRAAGIRYVAVRNDLRIDAQGSAPIAVHEALAESGIDRVASFGPSVSSPVAGPDTTANERTILPYPSVEIFDAGPVEPARTVPMSDVLVGRAAPEDVPVLYGALGERWAGVFGSDAKALPDSTPGRTAILTDGFRRREVAFGRPTSNTSGVLAPADPGTTRRRTIDYVNDDEMAPVTRSWGPSIKDVRVSSASSDANATLRLGPAYGPAAALDGDPLTRWVSGTYLRAVGEWFEVELTSPRDIDGTTIRLSGASPVEAQPARLLVETDGGRESVAVPGAGEWRLRTPPGVTSRVRITLEAVQGGQGSGFAISELTLQGLAPEQSLAVPPPAARGVDAQAVVLRVQNPGRTGCQFVGERPLCSPRFTESSEEAAGIRRTLDAPSREGYRWTGTVLPTTNQGVERLLTLPTDIEVAASSRWVPGLAARPGSVVDRDLGTGWVADRDDAKPTLTLTLSRQRSVWGLQFQLDPGLAASRPERVEVRLDGGRPRSLKVDAEGYVRFPAQRVKRLSVQMTTISPVTDVDLETGFRSTLPAGVSELRVLGADDLRHPVDADNEVRIPCGFGPELRVNGEVTTTEVTGRVRDILRGMPMTWRGCGERGDAITLRGGANDVEAPASAEFVPETLVLTQPGVAAKETPGRVAAQGSGYAVPAREEESVLVVPHNFSAGWTAQTDAGMELRGLRVNGWQQGWVLPPGPPLVVDPVFAPDRLYRAGLAVGAAVLGGLAVLALLLAKRRTLRRDSLRPGSARVAVTVVGAGLLLLNTGPAGVAAVASVLAVLAIAARARWRSVSVTAVLAGSGAVAALLVAASPWTEGGAQLRSPWVQGFVVAAFALVLTSSWWRGARDGGPSG